MRLLTTTIFFFFFNDTATTEIYTLSLHDALPICVRALATRRDAPVDAGDRPGHQRLVPAQPQFQRGDRVCGDRKSTRLNSSHLVISYAVFCLKKKQHAPQATSSLPAQTSVTATSSTASPTT